MPYDSDERDVSTFDLCPSCAGRGGSCEACFGEGTGPGQGRTWRELDREGRTFGIALFLLVVIGLALLVHGLAR